MGDIDWSPELATSWATIAAWSAIVQSCLWLKVSSCLIRWLLKKAGLQIARNIMLIQAKKNLHEEYKHYKGLKKNASAMRTTFLERLATLQAQDRDINVQTHFTQLRAHEAAVSADP